MYDLITYANLISLIIKRFDEYRSNTTREKEIDAARILKSANILKVSLRQLDNSFKAETGKLRRFRATMTPKEKEEIEIRVREFAEQEVILPNIVETVAEILEFVSESREDYAPLAKEIADYGSIIIISARRGCDFTTLFGEPEMDRLLEEMWQAKDEDAAQRVRDKAREMLDVYDRTILATVEDKFGKLKDMILHTYRNIPQPL